MKTSKRILLILGIFCSYNVALGQHPVKKSTKYEVGVVVGTPAFVQPVVGFRFKNNLGIRVSGMILSRTRGVQVAFLLNIRDGRIFHWNVEVDAGYGAIYEWLPGWTIRSGKLIPDKFRVKNEWAYIGFGSSINVYGVFLSAGLSLGRGDFTNPQFLGQFGYVYRFRR